MRLAVASGKGGTGKTILATSLALAWQDVCFVDCDVEGPDAHILLRPVESARDVVTVPVPRVLEDLGTCTHVQCGACADFCRYHALVVLPGQVLVFDDLCHACGGCSLVCPVNAIREVTRPMGCVSTGSVHRASGPDIPFVQGILDEGEVLAVPVIREAIRRASSDRDVIFDSPPGASCPMLAVAEAADVVLLVTEPTPFGLHDLEAAVEAVRLRDRPLAVVVNRADWGGDEVRTYCERAGIPVVLEIPHMREVAEGYARAMPLVESMPSIRARLRELRDTLAGLAQRAVA